MILSLFILAALTLIWLAMIDLKLRLLPDELTGALGVLGVLFQLVTHATYMLAWWEPVAGAVIGAGFLYLIRAAGNRHYGFETMGLGDVKLMAAGGLWLGLQGIVLALGIGAFCGVLHGVGFVVYERLNGRTASLKQLSMPAGPGFIAGLVLTALWKFWP